ncbi:hypothetical protein B9G99_14960 [Kushneria konosiri]|uniref:Uncharacterized protein n=1 Tax=Kushneria konosiri TaxID=698828 RepID=A0A2Z2H992_9GAMM|nr:hypothetical protein B9G99_14960 [Kushneria konosiri]
MMITFGHINMTIKKANPFKGRLFRMSGLIRRRLLRWHLGGWLRGRRVLQGWLLQRWFLYRRLFDRWLLRLWWLLGRRMRLRVRGLNRWFAHGHAGYAAGINTR